MHTVNKKLHVCKWSAEVVPVKKKIWIYFATATLVYYTQCAICTRFQTPFVGIVILTNPTLNAASLHYVDNDHALRKFGGMVIGYGELF